MTMSQPTDTVALIRGRVLAVRAASAAPRWWRGGDGTLKILSSLCDFADDLLKRHTPVTYSTYPDRCGACQQPWPCADVAGLAKAWGVEL